MFVCNCLVGAYGQALSGVVDIQHHTVFCWFGDDGKRSFYSAKTTGLIRFPVRDY